MYGRCSKKIDTKKKRYIHANICSYLKKVLLCMNDFFQFCNFWHLYVLHIPDTEKNKLLKFANKLTKYSYCITLQKDILK